ncbi:hypothetical protein EMIHUDRAFT_423627 [Emiliania huxleyi CCMP1516]|uniref:Ribosome biogenesis protein NOP53 n=2 Tax=Emiliania huxleyi TaxID=2903 RepID=A0A0D3JRC0_EMIH1|nr:hypothetical protein EMIHUDRAFT_443507 [Emiliania huxleyi CCMP1516]XP_005786131.1 hypothetical protein EMIHUDRAFT_423627 [Emiliania huxleyi CCMP1516]EOD26055.1 hypothetical protein EMIHUDRAFT_443507 [Emiliania huxleyi CCMP1516]EOD33702.1 hypothetical protein EMIHUDRAFT_423627 [Emiliania huxleyi CCMP1516]|mmetsp:Transcript_40806/g.131224  ORF Transcript_40806/g.131224 Transcript_40806/m.131224 type:complete len:163 (+) Transcript_40806:67-555(+)|eukprot:XP_005778484.1 hypothetical protein EMIHUDRAFT_443507 [Emiliania huxleyi CCMP1516]
MAKSIRSKVKKRLRSVKRTVIKKQRLDPASKLGEGGAKALEILQDAKSGHLRPPSTTKNAFRYDGEDAVIPQHNWRQGPDFRSSYVGFEAGYALVGASRPKLGRHGGDAPSTVVDAPADPTADRGVARLHRETEQLVPAGASKRLKRKLKKSGVDNNVFRWT